MTESTFNPEAVDGDNDGLIQEGTPFERPVDQLLVNPVEEVVAETAAEPVEEEVVAEEPKKPTPKPTPKPAPAPVVKSEEKPEIVAIFSTGNLVWPDLGKIVKGYNLVSKEASEKWLTLKNVRLATPEEIKARLG